MFSNICFKTIVHHDRQHHWPGVYCCILSYQCPRLPHCIWNKTKSDQKYYFRMITWIKCRLFFEQIELVKLNSQTFDSVNSVALDEWKMWAEWKRKRLRAEWKRKRLRAEWKRKVVGRVKKGRGYGPTEKVGRVKKRIWAVWKRISCESDLLSTGVLLCCLAVSAADHLHQPLLLLSFSPLSV